MPTLSWKMFRPETDAYPLTRTKQMKKTQEKLEKMSEDYKKEVSREAKKEKELRKAGDANAANLCLEMKRQYEGEIERLRTYQFRIKQLITNLVGVKATTETVDALTIGGAELDEMLKDINIDDACQTINGIDEQLAGFRQFQDSLQTIPVAAADFDVDEPEAHHNQQLLQPATTAPAASVHLANGARPLPQRTRMAV